MTTRETSGKLPLALPATLLAIVFIVAGAAPISSLWGFNHLKYFPGSSTLIYGLLLMLVLIPYTAGKLNAFFRGISNSFMKLPLSARLFIAAVLSIAIFYLLRVHVHSLGDGYQRIYQVERGYLYYHTEPLDFFLHAVLYRMLKIFGVDSGELSYILLSFACGVAFILTVSLIKLPEARNSNASSLIKLLVICLGGVQFFFGYVESYTLFYVFSLLYLLYGARFVTLNRGLLTASILLTFAMASHMTGAVFIPSFIYLVYYNFRYCRPGSFTKRYLPIILVMIPALGLVGQEIWLRVYVEEYVPSVSGGILPIFSTSEYSIFSPAHLFDILNEFLLIAPISIVLIIYALLRRNRAKTGKPLVNFGLLVTVFSVFMLLAIDPKLGLARDWDLFSIPTAAIGISVVLYSFLRTDSGRVSSYTRFVLAGMAVLFISSWVLTNASEKRQLVRAEDLLSLSDRNRSYSTELLAYYYRHKAKDSRKAYELLISIPEEERSARVYGKIAKTQIDQRQQQDGLESAYKGLELDSNFAELHAIAGVTLTVLGQPELGLPHLLKARYLRPNDFQVYHSLGNAYYRLDSLGMAVLAFKETIRLNPRGASAYIEAGNMYRLLGQYDSAIVYTHLGLRLNPNYPQGYQLLEMIKKEMLSETDR